MLTFSILAHPTVSFIVWNPSLLHHDCVKFLRQIIKEVDNLLKMTSRFCLKLRNLSSSTNRPVIYCKGNCGQEMLNTVKRRLTMTFVHHYATHCNERGVIAKPHSSAPSKYYIMTNPDLTVYMILEVIQNESLVGFCKAEFPR